MNSEDYIKMMEPKYRVEEAANGLFYPQAFYAGDGGKWKYLACQPYGLTLAEAKNYIRVFCEPPASASSKYHAYP